MVHQAEIMPVNLTYRGWADRLRGRRALAFVDNDAAKYAVISGTSQNIASSCLVESLWEDVSELQSFLWVERVPSESNISEGPSRLEFSVLE